MPTYDPNSQPVVRDDQHTTRLKLLEAKAKASHEIDFPVNRRIVLERMSKQEEEELVFLRKKKEEDAGALVNGAIASTALYAEGWHKITMINNIDIRDKGYLAYIKKNTEGKITVNVYPYNTNNLAEILGLELDILKQLGHKTSILSAPNLGATVHVTELKELVYRLTLNLEEAAKRGMSVEFDDHIENNYFELLIRAGFQKTVQSLINARDALRAYKHRDDLFEGIQPDFVKLGSQLTNEKLEDTEQAKQNYLKTVVDVTKDVPNASLQQKAEAHLAAVDAEMQRLHARLQKCGEATKALDRYFAAQENIVTDYSKVNPNNIIENVQKELKNVQGRGVAYDIFALPAALLTQKWHNFTPIGTYFAKPFVLLGKKLKELYSGKKGTYVEPENIKDMLLDKALKQHEEVKPKIDELKAAIDAERKDIQKRIDVLASLNQETPEATYARLSKDPDIQKYLELEKMRDELSEFKKLDDIANQRTALKEQIATKRAELKPKLKAELNLQSDIGKKLEQALTENPEIKALLDQLEKLNQEQEQTEKSFNETQVVKTLTEMEKNLDSGKKINDYIGAQFQLESKIEKNPDYLKELEQNPPINLGYELKHLQEMMIKEQLQKEIKTLNENIVKLEKNEKRTDPEEKELTQFKEKIKETTARLQRIENFENLKSNDQLTKLDKDIKDVEKELAQIPDTYRGTDDKNNPAKGQVDDHKKVVLPPEVKLNKELYKKGKAAYDGLQEKFRTLGEKVNEIQPKHIAVHQHLTNAKAVADANTPRIRP